MLFDRKIYVSVGLIMTLIFLGCSDQSESKASADKPQSAKAGSMKAKGGAVKGTIMETFDSGGYTYMKLDTGEGETWAATGRTEVQKDQSVTLKPGPVMRDFHSKSLDRTFSEIIFSSGLVGQEKAAGGGKQKASPDAKGAPSFQDAMKAEGMGGMSSPAPAAKPGGESGGNLKAVTSAQDISVEKVEAENGYTIGEVYNKAGELNGEKVRVRGQVMKVSPNIMGKTWIHLQDGTGNAMDNTHDLVFTSQAIPEKGQTIVLEGVLAQDKDFGAGYRYKAIVEKAQIVE